MTPDQLTDLITPIIAAHVQVVTDPHLSRCLCGWEVPRRHSGTQRHHKHQATMIANMILGKADKP